MVDLENPYQRLPKGKDRRVKLTDKQRREIRDLKGKKSSREVAKMYKVTKNVILYIRDPEKYERAKEQRRERGKWGRYYDKKKNTKNMRKTRAWRKENLGE